MAQPPEPPNSPHPTGATGASQPAAPVDSDYIAAVNEYRAHKDEAFGASPDSPIARAERASFGGLVYFPADPAYRMVASVVPYAQQEVVQLGSTRGDIRPQVRFAELRFTLAGEALRLTGFQDVNPTDGDELFVPFRDGTTGKESYGAGRYLEAHIEEDERGGLIALLDFNLAYSPWCAYNDAYSCTLPPIENTLSVAIEAGERTYHEHS